MKDYEAAITDNTGLLLKVHTSNYRIEGFTKSVSVSELVALGKTRGIKVMEDLGSGSLIDFSKYGLTREPTVSDAVAAGADIVTSAVTNSWAGPRQASSLETERPLNRSGPTP